MPTSATQDAHPIPGFRDVRFGMASAESESAEYPDLLLRGYLDPFDLIIETPFSILESPWYCTPQCVRH
jgi:hypothetical protein